VTRKQPRRAGTSAWSLAEQFLAVAAAEQEGEPLQVAAQLVQAAGRMADEVGQRRAEAAWIAGQPGAAGSPGTTCQSCSNSSGASPATRTTVADRRTRNVTRLSSQV
jgi:hypothetical protein